jgi:NADH-quinone oxidoreductase subunit F
MEEIDLLKLQPALDRFGPQGRTALLPALYAAQDLYGYIPETAAAAIAAALDVPPVEVYGVIQFYTLFFDKPLSSMRVHVCADPACVNAGADGILKWIHQNSPAHSSGAQDVVVERTACLGLCEHAPAIMVNGATQGHNPAGTWEDLIRPKNRRHRTILGGDLALLTANCAKGHTVTLPEYEAAGGYSALRAALRLPPAQVIETIKASGLQGRGGAAFPTGVKWEAAARGAAPRYVVCNADEAEPGTFKDRVLLEDDPHSILEGLILSGYAIGAAKGYIYIRGEYLQSYESMTQAVEEALRDHLLGPAIQGSDFSFEVEIRRGGGAYVCGEETALFESIEGKRGFPRLKPPFPTTSGLFGRPTVISNVETLANVPLILRLGADAYRQIGTAKSSGTKLFCLSGDVQRPGLYEVAFGVTFRHVLYDLAGGPRAGHHLQAALFGGAAGAFATPKDLDVALTFEDLRSAGLPLGSGVITVFDETRDMAAVLLRLADFFAGESCGKCYPCQMGTQRQHEIIHRVAERQPLPGDAGRLHDLAQTMRDTSICGLGQTASSAVQSAMKLWPDLFHAAE